MILNGSAFVNSQREILFPAPYFMSAQAIKFLLRAASFESTGPFVKQMGTEWKPTLPIITIYTYYEFMILLGKWVVRSPRI